MDELKTYSEVEIRNFEELEASFLRSSSVLKRDYLNNLIEYQAVELPSEVLNQDITDYVRLYDITKLVYNKEEGFIEKFTTISRALHMGNASVLTCISSDGKSTRYIIGIVNKHYDIDMTPVLGEVLDGAIAGNFPGSITKNIKNDDVKSIIDNISKYSVVSSISNVASLRNEDQDDISKYVQGIENLIESLRGKEYTILTIADPISNNECSVVKDSLEQLYSQLSGFAKTEMSMNENSSVSNSDSYSKSFSKTISHNTTVSQSHTSQTGWNTSTSESESKTKNHGAVAVALAGVAAVGLTVATGGLAAVAGAAAAGAALSGTAVAGVTGAAAITGAGSIAGGLIGSKTKGTQRSSGTNGSEADTTSDAISEGEQETSQESKTKTLSKNIGSGRTLSFSVENRTVKGVLDSIDTQLERLKLCGSYGAFSSCTYVLTNNVNVNTLASGLFNALISGEKSNIQVSKVNTWGLNDSDENVLDLKTILESLSHFTHPHFTDFSNSIEFTPASLISGKELSIQMGFPKKSVQGLSIVYKVPFGRNVLSSNDDLEKMVIGNVYNMGFVEKTDVTLDKNSLTSHVFVTGSTGSGKSNTIYNMLSSLCTDEKSDVHFMVVEPAKGEYKHAFYKHPKIKTTVYGTNPKKNKLLKINPFAFPDDIHILEHIDRLVEILNVCWPMYAAMPVILKNSVIKAYQKCGWDITNSCKNSDKTVYPGFADVLECINEILESTAFSQENKGDYTGALCTRVESLTTGLNGLIFCVDEIDNHSLFDMNVIVDLSRIGSVETKSLIMGLLVMKLQEYRMSENYIPNQPLRHIMVLEEAHNLLKKTSTEQSSESSNLVGKSVEMITNAIAEMRTYGEGFFIVDQSPSMLDSAVIRNTNTKIVLRLPEGEDRETVGKSMSLSDEQIVELAKLEKGCAAVYQNDWEEAVICQFEQYHKSSDKKDNKLDEELFVYESYEKVETQSDIKVLLLQSLIDLVIDETANEKVDNVRIINQALHKLAVSNSIKKKIASILEYDNVSLDDISSSIVKLFGCDEAIEKAKDSKSIEDWNRNILNSVDPEINKLSQHYIDNVLQCLMIEQAKKDPEFRLYAEKWVDYMKEVK